VRVSAAVLVLVTERSAVVRVAVVVVVAAVAGVVVALATATGWSGAFDAWRFSLAKIVIPPKLLSVIAAASARSISVDAISGLLLRRVRVAMSNR
jgi:hypothetical protein